MSSLQPSLRTSSIDFITSVHGEQRRRERNITKRDLQAAIKYGTKERTVHPWTRERRWKYTYADVVYITDSTSTKEVTSYSVPLPLHEYPINQRLFEQIKEGKKRLAEGYVRPTSHTVLVVDQSGSMNKSDVPGHRTRSQGVFYSLANDFVAEQL